MKKHFLIAAAFITFGAASAQDNGSRIIAEVLPKNEIKSETEKTEKNEKKSKKNKAEKKVKKTDTKKQATTTPKRYYIDSSGQKTYIE